jgi:hypothetical protein
MTGFLGDMSAAAAAMLVIFGEPVCIGATDATAITIIARS